MNAKLTNTYEDTGVHFATENVSPFEMMPHLIPSEMKDEMKRAKNVILFICDGMGPTTVTAARVLKGQIKGNSGPEDSLLWDQFRNVALAKARIFKK